MEFAQADAYNTHVNPARVDLLQSWGGPLVFSKAKGAWLEDSEGHRYLDLVAGYGAATLGHGHPELISVLSDAMSAELPFNYPHSISTVAGELAAKLCKLAGRKLNKVHFGNSGAEGIEGALKFAMAHTGRSKFLSFSQGFHGLTLGALSLINADEFKAKFPATALTAHQVAFEDLDELEHHLKNETIAGVVVEIVQGMAGARPWRADKLVELSTLCHHYGAVLIVDEVLTGIGRTGNWFAFQGAEEKFEPDIVVVAKGLTGGMVPVSAVLMTDEVYSSVYDSIGQAYAHASTFEANLLAMIVGLEVIRIIEREDLLSRVMDLASAFERRLRDLQENNLGILDVRVSGLLIGFHVADSAFKDEILWGAAGCRRHLIQKGVLIHLAAQAPSYNYLTPPFILSDADTDFFFTQLETSLREESMPVN